MRAVSIATALLLSSSTLGAQDVDASVASCLRLGANPRPSLRRALARRLAPHPSTLSLSAGFAVGPEAEPHASVTLRGALERLAPFYAEGRAAALIGERIFVAAELLVGGDLSARRGTWWRGAREGVSRAPWSMSPPEGDDALDRWLEDRAPECGITQGTWRLLGGARLFAPLDGVMAGPPLQLALMAGATRSASTRSDGARTGLDVGVFAMFDPMRVRPGVLGRIGAAWGSLHFGLEGAWMLGPEGYAYALLDVGFTIGR